MQAPLFLAIEGSLRASGVPESTVDSVVGVIDSHPESGRPSAAWYGRAEQAAAQLEDPVRTTVDLLDVLIAHPAPTSGIVPVDWHRPALGVVRFASVSSSQEIVDRLARIARSGQTDRLTMACVGALVDPAVPRAATALIALEREIRHGLVLIEIRKGIERLAAETGRTREDFEELAVERHDLDADGRRVLPVGDGALEIQVSAREVALRYVGPDGRARASIPAKVRASHAEEITSARADVKAIKTTVASERARLDLLMASARRWPVEAWRSRYLDHPVTGRMARSLIWAVDVPGGEQWLGLPLDHEHLQLVDGTTAQVPPASSVALWHPVTSTPDVIAGWRARLTAEEVVQPIKQAFREIYVLTPAEEVTERYSNRFAGHIFRQVQARALFRRRSWRSTALAWWDDGHDVGVASKPLAGSGLVAEFVYDPIEDVTSDGDLYPLCTSDQVRFRDSASDELVQLLQVGLVPFSEAMRDVDLAIGVTSIGADPEWADRGLAREHPGRFDAYYAEFTTGPLGASAALRRDLIAQMLPALSISDRCELEERFLVVRGDRTTYRIHLGTGNVRMAPDDRYLCIVTARDARAGRLFLPFDDDRTLTLILSKAFLLSDDRSITDETILAQLPGGAANLPG